MNKRAKLIALSGFYKSKGIALSWYQVEVLQRLARQFQTNAEKLCNEENYKDKIDKLKEHLFRTISPEVKETEVEITGDPRGFCLKIITKDGETLYPETFN